LLLLSLHYQNKIIATNNFTMNKNRLETICDGIFAIVMTLLILDVRLPANIEIHSNADLINALLTIKPKIISFAASFFVIGGFLVGHHFIFSLISKSNGLFLWINILYLLTISFLPFPTSIYAENSDKYAALCFYAFNLILCGGFHTLMFWIIYKNENIRKQDVKPADVKKYFLSGLFGTLSNVVAILFGLISVKLGFIIFIATPIYFIVSRLIIEKKQTIKQIIN
jgi:uncharacterized membrane protein